MRDMTGSNKLGIWSGMGLYEESMTWLKSVAGKRGNLSKLSDELGEAKNLLSRWFAPEESKNHREPSWRKMSEVLEKLGARIVFEESTPALPQTRDIEFINPKIISADEGTPPPASEDYFAVPLATSPVAAGPGRINEDTIRGWVLVWRHHESIRFRTHLVAVEIGQGEMSMVPTLHPGDIVLVDRADKDPGKSNKIMLVCEPGQEGGCMIKRVSSRRVDGDIELVYYSDNAKEYPPRVFHLNRDYGGNPAAAIGGRVVWAWSDMTRK